MPRRYTPELGLPLGLTVISHDVKPRFDLPYMQAVVAAHNKVRPAYWVANGALSMRQYVVSEASEVQDALIALDGSRQTAHDLHSEMVDLLIIIFSQMSSRNMTVDPTKVWPYVNGQGRSSGIFERIERVAGDISHHNLDRSLHELLVLAASLINHSPELFNVYRVLWEVKRKNDGNHPAAYYQPEDYFTGEQLTQPEQIEKYRHSVAAMRIIRRWFKNAASTAGREDLAAGGVPRVIHELFAKYIQNHRESAWALQQIEVMTQTPEAMAVLLSVLGKKPRTGI